MSGTKRTWQAMFRTTGGRYVPKPMEFYIVGGMVTPASEAGRRLEVLLSVGEARRLHANLGMFLHDAQFNGEHCEGYRHKHVFVEGVATCQCGEEQARPEQAPVAGRGSR